MHKKCDLEMMKLPALLLIAKERNIRGRHEMRKNQIIDAIIETNEPEAPEIGDRTKYVDNIRIGVLVAFRVNDQKALSGKIEEIHVAGFVVKTKNGIRFNVRKKNIMWVKTGERWPKGVYLALKGVQEVEAHKAVN